LVYNKTNELHKNIPYKGLSVRIIAGEFKSRIIKDPKGYVAHPMSERVRSALFNILHNLNDKTILDAYAGSGALAIEAVSRGAKSAVAVEKDFRIYKILKGNVESLKLEDRIHATRANVHQWLKGNRAKRFDIIFADPPYDKYNSAQIQKLIPYLAEGAILVLSYPSEEKPPALEGVDLQVANSYGNASLAIYHQ